MTGGGSPIEEYVAGLAGLLRLPPQRAERLLAEVDDHLRSTAEAGVAAGLEPVAAEREAVRRCGSPRDVAFTANGGLVGAGARLVAALAGLAAVGSLAVLVGTLVARAAAAVTSTAAVYGLPPGATPSRGQVAHWLAVQPTAGSWRSAAALENADDSLVLRGGAALLAVVACAAVAVVLSRRFGRVRSSWLPVIAAVAFGGAAAVLFGLGAARVPLGDWGRGQAWSDASVALVAALGCCALPRRQR
jgi:hypothetical protein